MNNKQPEKSINKKPWSISTTVRNPDRLRGFLRVLQEIEGEPFNQRNQEKYQVLLIQHKLYKPMNLTARQKEYFETPEKMAFSIAQDIFDAQSYEDPPMRGRTSVAPMDAMGFCVAKSSTGPIRITELGRKVLDNEDIGEIFFRCLLKWQLPNLKSKEFSKRKGFSIKPFVGTLHLINKVNTKWSALGHKPVGINKEEFSLFATTLIDHKSIDEQADALIQYRKGIRACEHGKEFAFKENYAKRHLESFLETTDEAKIKKVSKNLADYGDNTIRYFRLTRYLRIRGDGFHIDLEPMRSIEIEKLLKTDDAAPLEFENVAEYSEYITDMAQPVLPWEAKPELLKIVAKLVAETRKYAERFDANITSISDINLQQLRALGVTEIKERIVELRAQLRKLQGLAMSFETRDFKRVQEYIERLENIYQSRKKKSVELERLATLALNALNDARDIKPNYPVGDDNEPTFTAPANKPDIECFYVRFNSICEVTMLTGRNQWYNEGQPVMRHLRDFENAHDEKDAYCLFIAPKLHQDTMETFWLGIKHGYHSKRQKIVPLTIPQFVMLLRTLLRLKEQGKRFRHGDLQEIYDQILELTNQVEHSMQWLKEVPRVITRWQRNIVDRN